MGVFTSPFLPKYLLKNPRDEDGFPAKGGLMTILRQGRVVLPLWDHEKNAIPYGVPSGLADIKKIKSGLMMLDGRWDFGLYGA